MTARTVPLILEARGAEPASIERVSRIVQLQELAGVIGLMLVAAFFRPQGPVVAWQLPGSAWLFITLGMGAAIGGIAFLLLHYAKAGPEFTVLTLGIICFAAGMSSFLRLSPVAVCFIAGVILVNFAGQWREQVRDSLRRLERPVYLLFLLIAGALWQVRAWQGWVLMALFVVFRLGGKWLAMRLVEHRGLGRELTPLERRGLVIAPLGALSIAMVVTAQDLYFGPSVSWLVTAVIGGAIATEIVIQALSRAPAARLVHELAFIANGVGAGDAAPASDSRRDGEAAAAAAADAERGREEKKRGAGA